MFNDMCHTGRISGWCTKSDIEDLIIIPILNEGETGAGLLMTYELTCGMDSGQVLSTDQFIALRNSHVNIYSLIHIL